MRYDARHRSSISFPLGGIGTGSIGLSGSGRLVDWEIANRPNKQSWNPYAHFAVRAETDGRVVDARLLNGDLEPPYTGVTSPIEARTDRYVGYGFGATRELLPGLPHFRETDFDGAFPAAEMTFRDPAFPGVATLRAFNPFIPLNSFDSSLPCALFEFELHNPTSRPVLYTLAGTLPAYFRDFTPDMGVVPAPARTALTLDGAFPALHHVRRDVAPDASGYGELLLAARGADAWSGQESWYRGGWQDGLTTYWRDFTRPGPLRPRAYPEAENTGIGTLAGHVEVAPGASRRLAFAVAWYFPTRNLGFLRPGFDGAAWRNGYATQFSDAAGVARYALEHYDRLRRETFAFRAALFDSTLPPEVLDAVSANLSTLKSPTCLRLENGEFYGFEGNKSLEGSCEGSCTHVWNYAYALPFLFPDLERSMRELDFTHNFRPDGGLGFRLQLPPGEPPSGMQPCADGQFGGVLKTYREWKISGDDAWLARWFPAVKRSIEYAWSPENADRWDPERSGVLTGRQHHTLDVELFGANAWLTGFYLAALKAGAAMADAVGADADAAEWRAVFECGRAYVEAELFNGEYYAQRIDVKDRALLAPYGEEADAYYWNAETEEIKYQAGDGCFIDQVLAQWHADLVGLGDVFDPTRVDSALMAIFRHNFLPSLREHANCWRVFGLNDEAGTLIATWPRGGEPAIPIPYASETMHGFEYQAASHLILRGYVDEGLRMVKAVRDRYDGAKRNPWNEIECGSNYARSMASYALLNAFGGFRFDLTQGMLGFAPRTPPGHAGEFRVFWCVDGAWGLFRREDGRDTLDVRAGRLALRRLELDRAGAARGATLGGRDAPFTVEDGALRFAAEAVVTPTAPLVVLFDA